MKKIILSIALVATVATTYAQSAFKVGLGGAFNSTWLINKNVSDANDEMDVAITWGGDFGLNLQYYFNENVGLGLGIMRSGHNQKYTGDFKTNSVIDYSYDAKMKLRYMDVPLTLRLGGNEKGAYFEFGPQFSFLTKATWEYEDTYDGVEPDYDAKDDYKPLTVGFVMGFGVDIKAGDSFTISTGLRLGYMGNATKEFTEDEWDAKAMAAYVSGESPSMYVPYLSHYTDAGTTDNTSFKYQPTHRIVGGIFLGVVYTIPMK